MTTWGVYGLQGRDTNNNTVPANDRTATRWFIRWRVDGRPHARTLAQKGHAKTFRDILMRAELNGWPADERGWPMDPDAVDAPPPSFAASPADGLTARLTAPTIGQSFAEYCEHVWWPSVVDTLNDKNMLGHRRNMRLAIELLTYASDDHRSGNAGRSPGGSIHLADLTADDLRHALSARRRINARTAAANDRLIRSSFASGAEDVTVRPETASPATVRAFFITLHMIVTAARNSGRTTGDPLLGVARLAPTPRPQRVSDRVVPSLGEIHDLAEAIASFGPMVQGRPAGDRFRALVIAAGTLGARPGELVAHQTEWIDFGTADVPTLVAFEETEAAVYDTETNLRGRRVRSLKHRAAGERRVVPAPFDTSEALRTHLEKGYSLGGRTFSSPTGRARLDWGNIRENIWRPACEKVFAGGVKSALATMPPKTLRKAAITIWLEAGVSIHTSADWAGHSSEVAELHYVGRTRSGFEKELHLLADYSEQVLNPPPA